MSLTLPVCQVGCDTSPAPAQFDNCNPEVHQGPIEYLYIGTRGNPFADWTVALDWADRIDNTTIADPLVIRQFRVIGTMPRPEANQIVISGNRKIVASKNFTLELEVDETNDVNREWVRNNECNGNYAIWFETSNVSGQPGLLFGGNDGVEGFVLADYTIEREENAIHKIMLTVTFTQKFSPESIVSPIQHT